MRAASPSELSPHGNREELSSCFEICFSRINFNGFERKNVIGGSITKIASTHQKKYSQHEFGSSILFLLYTASEN